jgi:hypothetical protein
LQRNAFVDGQQLRLRRRLPRLDLAHAGQGLETEFVTLAEQLDGLGVQGQGPPRQYPGR